MPAVQRAADEREGVAGFVRERTADVSAVGQIRQGQVQRGFDFADLAGSEQVFQAIFVAAVGIDAEPRHQRVVQEHGSDRDGDFHSIRLQNEFDATLAVLLGERDQFARESPSGGLRGFESQRRFAGGHGDDDAAAGGAAIDLRVGGDAGGFVPHEDVLEIAFRFSDRQRGHGHILVGADACKNPPAQRILAETV